MRYESEIDRAAGGWPDCSVYGQPEDVLNDSRLSVGEKRAVLASLASDELAVENAPDLRNWPTGSFVKVADIVRALKVLDQIEAAQNRGSDRGDAAFFCAGGRPSRGAPAEGDGNPPASGAALPFLESLNWGALEPN